MSEKVIMTQVIDEEGNTKIIHPETSSDNVLHGHNTLDKLITLDGSTRENFNFIENGIEKNGLIKEFFVQKGARQAENTSENKYSFIVSTTVNKPGWIVSSLGRFGVRLSSSNHIEIANSFDTSLIKRLFVYDGGILNIAFWQVAEKPNEFGYCVNGEIGFISHNGFSYSTQVYAGRTEGNVNDSKCALYDKLLTSLEIQHNSNALNNSPSLKSTEITDTEGRKTTLLFSSDGDHVEMRTGRTVEEEYMGVLSTMGKEFTADATGKISVDNGVKARLISGEMQGQTVKCVTPNKGVITLVGDGSKFINGEVLLSECRYAPNTTYTLIGFIYENTLSEDFRIGHAHGASIYPINLTIPRGTTGILPFIFTSKSDFTGLLTGVKYTSISGTVTGTIKFSISVLEGSYSKSPIANPIEIGLASTQAVLNNNGNSYPIYESMIYGKTRILKAPKGTQNWVEIDASEARDTTKFDYKLDSINDDLGSVPSVYDVVDRARKVKLMNTKESIVHSEGRIMYQPTLNSPNCYAFSVAFDNVKQTTTGFLYQCNNFPNTEYTSITSKDFEFITGYNVAVGGFVIHIQKSKISEPTVEAFKTLSQANNTIIRYQLATPIEATLTDEEFKAYDKYKKLILLPFAEDTFTLNLDGSATWIDASDMKTFNGSESILSTTLLENTVRAIIQMPNGSIGKTKGIVASGLNTISVSDDVKGIWCTASDDRIGFNVPKSELTTHDDSGMKEWLKNNNQTTCFLTDNPITTHIPKELVPAILTDKINILEVKSPVAPSSFKVVSPVDDRQEIKDRLTALEKTLVQLALK